MSYRVVFSHQALREMEEAADWWAEHRSSQQAARWYVGFSAAILTRRDNAPRFAPAAENDDFPYEIRELHFGLSTRPTHRAVYTVIGDNVVVLTIRHASQNRITTDDIEQPFDDLGED